MDGTDDVQLLVTILDAKGNETSQVAPVHLEVISGPGEFPTGRSNTFDPDSDIQVLDGKAAIEFRSYHGGTSVIRATSPGLEGAETTIVSRGEPRWIEGVTPPVEPRPYRRYAQQPVAAAAMVAAVVVPETILSLNRPTKASSTSPGTSTASVTDGKPDTVWQAADGDNAPWIQVDLENSYKLKRVQLRFPETGDYRYEIVVSSSCDSWTTIVDETKCEGTGPVRTAAGDFGSGVRFLRVNFTSWPQGKVATLAEIVAGGETE